MSDDPPERKDNSMERIETWDLESIFAGGSESPELAVYLRGLEADLTAAEQEGLPDGLTDETKARWVGSIQRLYDLGERLRQAGSFVGCLAAQDVQDERALQLDADLDRLGARLGGLWTRIRSAFAQMKEDDWTQLLADPSLEPVSFHLKEEREEARMKMPPDLEALANDLAADGYHGWNRLYGIVSSDPVVEFEGNPLSLGQLQSKMFDDPDRETRQAAFDLFEKTWSGIAKPCAAALNNQAGFRLALYGHRGWDDVLKEPLMENRMTAESLEAMWSVVDAKGVKLLDYFAAKARLLGVDRLSWFDVHAPMGRDDREFTFSEAADFTVENLRHVNPAMAEFSRMAIDRQWVEAENRPGKRAGGFCTGFPKSRESRIFMTFTGSLNSLMTLAHELGHAYHSWVMRDLPAGARRYPMSVAETASTFSETIVRNAAYRSAAGEEERLRVLAAKLDDAVSFLMDIRSRFAFETAFFRERRTRSLSVADLNALMEEAQHNAFRNALERYHPLFWASKLHFYITAAPFYNFPYTFGFLFSSGVYARAEDEGPPFQKAYVALLRDTGRMTTDELARKHLDIDLRQPDFWEDAADRVLDDVDAFTILANRIAGDSK